jgi:predicted ATPase
MISSFRLKFGRAPGVPPEDIFVSPITVFVGPNNSGKSRVLGEIANACQGGGAGGNSQLLETLNFAGLPNTSVMTAIERISMALGPGERLQEGQILIGKGTNRNVVAVETIRNLLQNPSANSGAFCNLFLRHSTLILNGVNRINLISDQQLGDLQTQPTTSLQTLFRDDAKRQEVRRILFDAFGVQFVIDPTSSGQLRIRLSNRAPQSVKEERSLDEDAIKFYTAALHISGASDGVKAFAGIIVELKAGDPSVLLIDEPEAFLHPSLASKLGLEVSRSAQSAEKRVFVSTHSPAFVMGCIQSGAPVTIVRLTYRGGVATARVLLGTDILELMRHPLLRSTGVLSGLFYEFVVVTESDADRAFYQEVNERLLQFRPEWGIPNCLFINAQNKTTVQMILRPLRKLGIPAAGIIDIDILKNKGSDWTNLLTSSNIPEISHQSLATIRAAVKEAMDATGRDMKRDGGLHILSTADREAAENLLTQLSNYGIFVVPGGELESWVKQLGATGHGPAWLIKVFEKMGENPEATDYVRPADGDVWKFMSQIKEWLSNPNRRGIPE